MPENLSDTTEVLISTSITNLNFHLNRTPEFYRDKKMIIYLASNEKGIQSVMEDSAIIKNLYQIPMKLQKGKYYINVTIPGEKSWDEIFEINKDTTNIKINLEQGSNVLFKVIAPGGVNADDDVQCELIKENNTDKYFFSFYDEFLGGFESLPIGNYRVKILSSEEKKEKRKELPRHYQNEIIPEYLDYQGKEITFTIDSESLETIDLGTIYLEPVN
jgi:hypothetical protein